MLIFVKLTSVFSYIWTLPENEGNTAGGYNNSYGNLLYKEGVINTETSTSYATGGFNKLLSPPLSFVRSGYHEATGTARNTRGSYGDYWTLSVYSSTNSRALRFPNDSIDLQYSSNKANGFSLRCVAW